MTRTAPNRGAVPGFRIPIEIAAARAAKATPPERRVVERGAAAPLGGGERYFSTTGHSGGNVAAGASFSAPAGIYATVERLADGKYRITERSGMKYLFERALLHKWKLSY